jgi:hypothetical protein
VSQRRLYIVKGVSYTLIVLHNLCQFPQVLMVCPIRSAKRSDSIASFQVCLMCGTPAFDSVDFGKRCLDDRLRARFCYRSCGNFGTLVFGRPCSPHGGIMLVKAFLNPIHEVFVVILQPYYPSSCCPNCRRISKGKLFLCQDRSTLCAMSRSSRGYPSKVVRLVFMLTPCFGTNCQSIPARKSGEGNTTYRI